jgi:two-component system, sensor histidine kinase and response regulator
MTTLNATTSVTAGQALQGSYDYRLVALSVMIAVLASYAALDLAGRVTSAKGRARTIWLTGGAIAMGLGIWSMHYVGMLAFQLPVPVLYDWPLVLAFLLAAIVASAIVLFAVSRRTMGILSALLGSVCMGGAIAGMHYIGMAAMRLPAMCHYRASIVRVSIALAIVISLVALMLTSYFRKETSQWNCLKAASALVMGVAVPVMHYTGMAAANFDHGNPGQSNARARHFSVGAREPDPGDIHDIGSDAADVTHGQAIFGASTGSERKAISEHR